MVRGRRRPLEAIAAAEDYSLYGSGGSSNFKAAEYLQEDGKWRKITSLPFSLQVHINGDCWVSVGDAISTVTYQSTWLLLNVRIRDMRNSVWLCCRSNQ